MRLSQIVDTVISELFSECGNIITLHPAQRERVVLSIAYRLKSVMSADSESKAPPWVRIDTDIHQRMVQHIQATIVTVTEGNEGYIEVSCRDCGAYYAGYSSAFKDRVEMIPDFQHKEGCLSLLLSTEVI
jgi:hypothetical protein